MVNRERYVSGEKKGLIDKWQRFNKFTRNGALLLAPAFAVAGVPALASAALVSAGFDQLQITTIDKARDWKKKREMIKSAEPKRGLIPWVGTIFERKPKITTV